MDLFTNIILILAILILFFFYAAGYYFAEVATEKGYPEKRRLVITLCILFPIAGYLLVCALPDKRKIH